MPTGKLRLAAPFARAPFVFSAVVAALWFASTIYLALEPASHAAEVFGITTLAFLGVQLAVTWSTALFAARAATALGDDRRAAPTPRRTLAWMTLPLVAHFGRWRALRGLLVDSERLVRGGGGDARAHLAVFSLTSAASSVAAFVLLQLVAAIFAYDERAWLGALVASAFLLAVPAVLAAWSGTLLVRRLELRFADAEVRERAEGFGALLGHAVVRS